jgi:phosphatidylinositol alpha-1,6-mannosyltransferase
MKTILLSPELFLREGGIARIMRLYLKALCEFAGPGDVVDSVVLNDEPGRDPRLSRYATAALRENTGCARSKVRFTRTTLEVAANADRIICGHLHQLPIAWLAAKLHRGVDYYLVAHGIDVWRPYTLVETAALRGATRILCISDYTRRQMLRFCPALEPARLVVVPNTLDPFFSPAGRPAPTPRAAGPRILTVGRLTGVDTYKGFDTLIEAMPLVRRRHRGATLRIAGGGDDLPRLRRLAESLGLSEAVTFTGIIDDDALAAEYAACDLFALPSRKEGFGLVYLEAMTYGKPCLAARAGGAPEVIEPAVGALAEYGNIPEIAAALNDLVLHPRDPAAVRRHAARFEFPEFKRRLAEALA